MKNRNHKHKKNFLFFLILVMGIGFAIVSRPMMFYGNSLFGGNKWDIHFENVQVLEGSVQADNPVISSNLTTVSFSVPLDFPGEKYEFTVDCVNAGTLNAVIDSIEGTELDSNLSQYFEYSVTYLDGTAVAKGDSLMVNEKVTYKVSLKYKDSNDSSSLFDENVGVTLSFSVKYVQSDVRPGYGIDTEFTKLVKSNANFDDKINLNNPSSVTNGNGLYMRLSTKRTTYPIYYYRGNVNNNNAKFAGLCWKIVRTTEKGGVKLVYNGEPDGNGDCTNTTGVNTQIGTSAFNNIATLAGAGYMYGTSYETSSSVNTSSYLYGREFDYNNGVYTLYDPVTSSAPDSRHHFTCFNSSGRCSEIYYIIHYDENTHTSIYFPITNGDYYYSVLEQSFNNTNNSVMKTTLDTWFSDTIVDWFTTNEADYNDYLEDSIWVNDRSIYSYYYDNPYSYEYSGWGSYQGDLTRPLRLGARLRHLGNEEISFTTESSRDRFTVSDTSNGNGKLTYPVGLLTADEVQLAGGTFDTTSNNSFYLSTGQNWWTMSPDSYLADSTGAGLLYVSSNSYLDYKAATDSIGVRPSITIQKDVKIASGGDGTSTNPYEFVLE